jgi:hypothetical protein
MNAFTILAKGVTMTPVLVHHPAHDTTMLFVDRHTNIFLKKIKTPKDLESAFISGV